MIKNGSFACTYMCICTRFFIFHSPHLPSVSNFKIFSRSLKQFFLTVDQNNFSNKIPLFLSFGILACSKDIFHFSLLVKKWKCFYNGHEINKKKLFRDKINFYDNIQWFNLIAVRNTLKKEWCHVIRLLNIWVSFAFSYWHKMKIKPLCIRILTCHP